MTMPLAPLSLLRVLQHKKKPIRFAGEADREFAAFFYSASNSLTFAMTLKASAT